jgi:hypothetical protein
MRKKLIKLKKFKKIAKKTKPCKKINYNFEKTDWFGFDFISLKLKKPNQTEPEKKKTEPNRKKPSQTKKSSQTGLNQFLSQKTKPNRNRSV